MANPTRACKQLSKAMSPTSPSGTGKRPKKIFGIDLPDKPEWPPLDMLWEIIIDKLSEMYFRQEQTIKEYKLASRIIVACLSLLV